MAGKWILVLNAGSSSLKFSAFSVEGNDLVASGQIASIGQDARLVIDGDSRLLDCRDHREAVDLALSTLREKPDLSGNPAIIGHRIVHGGNLKSAAIINSKIRKEIEAAANLAPLHNPPALSVIDALQNKFNELPQVACFDTGFHSSNPPEATTIPIPAKWREKGIRRYGFHGLSYASLVRRFEGETGQPLPGKLLAFHLGAGASLAAIVEGKGVATTMGFSPLDGLVMATRAGSIDPGVILHLMRSEGLSASDIDQMLNRESGLYALTDGRIDMKTLQESSDHAARFAISHYCYWVNRHAGSMIAAMNGIDGIVFTGGIGENSSVIRENIAKNMQWAGDVPAWVIATDEEGEIAQDVRRLYKG